MQVVVEHPQRGLSRSHSTTSPIRNASGAVFAAVSVTGQMDRVTRPRIPALAELVTATAAQLSRQLGYEAGTAGRAR